MKALEKGTEVSAAANRLRHVFMEGAEVIGKSRGLDVHWHKHLGIWGAFGKTPGRGGFDRDWNGFGQKPFGFGSNVVVEINPPNRGIDQNLQGLFAVDSHGQRWLLHQGRMSVIGSRITEADFIAATKLIPETVEFSDGRRGEYHTVTRIDAPAIPMQASVAAFVASCAQARLAKIAAGRMVGDQQKVQDWERGLSPEATGAFDIAAREAASGYRRHGEVWRSLTAELTKRGVPCSNDRVGQYGPDLFTYGSGPKILFEIKSNPNSQDIFSAVGQLQVYEKLLGSFYRKILVLPKGMSPALRGPIEAMGIDIVEFHVELKTIKFDLKALSECLKI